MPENKPASQGLTDIKTQNHQGRTVADKSNQHGIIDDILELIFADNIS